MIDVYDLSDFLGQIEKQIAVNEAICRPYSGRKKEEVTPELWEAIERLADLTSFLRKVKEDVLKEFRHEFKQYLLG